MRYLNPWLSYFYLQFVKTDVSQIGSKWLSYDVISIVAGSHIQFRVGNIIPSPQCCL